MGSPQAKTIYFITGASAVGKTTFVEELRRIYENRPWSFVHFDSIGVPTLGQMKEEFGSPSAWQKLKTFEWIDRLLHEYNSKRIFFEGSVDLRFIQEGFAKHNFRNYRIVLLDCCEDRMKERLMQRSQPDLFTEDMKTWLRYLRRQARASESLILDSSDLSPQQLVGAFVKATGL